MIDRIFFIVSAYLTASLASGCALAFGMWLSGPLSVGSWQQGSAVLVAFSVLYLGLAVTLGVAVLALVPALAIIGIAEAFRMRAAAFYAGAGTVTGIMCAGLLGWLAFRTGLTALVFGTAGLIGGLVYWRIAGRSAGDWRVTNGGKP